MVSTCYFGHVAVENPRLVEEPANAFNDLHIVSIDARDGFLATRGWVQETSLTTMKFAQQMANLASDGLFTRILSVPVHFPNQIFRLSRTGQQYKMPVIAPARYYLHFTSQNAEQLGVEGAIVGKALYTGDINLKAAITELN